MYTPTKTISFSPDCRNSQLFHGTFTLNATPGTVESITIPAGSVGVRLTSKTNNANIMFAVNEDPEAPGTDALTAGNTCAYGSRETRLLEASSSTLRVMSDTASAVVLVEFF
jgi:hypothetical protein